jgi:hypothetical protein
VNFGAWVTLVLLAASAWFSRRQDVLESLLCLALAVAVSRRAFPGPAKPSGEPAPPQRIRWLLLFAGLAFGWFGVERWAGVPRWAEGAVLQLFSLSCLVAAFPSRARVMGSETSIPPVPVAPAAPAAPPVPGSPLAAWLLFTTAAVLLVRSTIVFRTGALQPGLTLLFSGLAAAFLAVGFRRPGKEPCGRLPGACFWLGAILAAAALMRFPFVGKDFTGFQIDEANHLVDGVRVLKGELYSPFITGWWGNPSFVYYITAGFFDVFGIGLAQGRALSATLSLAALYLFYRLARFYTAPAAALLATLLFSFSWYHLYYSLSPFTDIYTVTFELAVFFLLERGLREGRRGDFVGAGLFLAASVMSYISGRLAVGMAAVSLFVRLLLYGRPFFRAYARHLLLTLLAFLWLIGPFLYFVKKSPEEFMGRSKELSIFTEIQRTGDRLLPLRTFAGTAMSFFRNADPDPRFGLYHVTTVDPLTAVFLVVGFMAVLWRPRSWLTWVVLPGLFFSIIANSMAIQGANPSPWYMNMQRFYLVVPFAFLLVAKGLEWFLDRLRESAGSLRKAFATLLTAALAVSAYLNADIYYRQFTNTPSTWDSMAFSHLQATRLCIQKFPTHHLLVDWEIFSSVGDFLTLDTGLQVVRVNQDFRLPVLRKAARDVVFLFIPYKNQEVQARVREVYPNAEWTTVLNTHGRPSLNLVQVRREDFEKAQGGRTEGPDLP